MSKAVPWVITIGVAALIVIAWHPWDRGTPSAPPRFEQPTPAPQAPPDDMTLGSAVTSGDITVTVTGRDVSRMTITVTSVRGMRITIPVGTRFASASAGTQNMMAAGTTQLELVAGVVQTKEIEVYCVNRFLDAPTEDSRFTASDPDGGSPLTALAECLDASGADHNTRQLAIWLVSDDIKDKTRDEAIEQFVRHTDEELGAQGASHLDYVLALAKKSGNYTDDDLQKLQEKYSAPDQREQLERIFRSTIVSDLEQYAEDGGPLLAKCGYDTSTLPFFQQ